MSLSPHVGASVRRRTLDGNASTCSSKLAAVRVLLQRHPEAHQQSCFGNQNPHQLQSSDACQA